jgi:hypothetical protein
MRGLNSRRKIKLLMGVFAILMLSGCAIADRMSGVSEARALQSTGERATATILQIWDTDITINNDPVVGFLLEVNLPGRPAYQAKTKLLISRIDIPRVQPGAVVPVRIDPHNPNRVALDIYEYGKSKKSPAI